MDEEMGWWRHGSWLALGALGAVATAGAVAYRLLPIAVHGLVEFLGLFFHAALWLASALSSGADAWTIAGMIGRATAEALMSMEMLAGMVALILVSGLALYGLQRVLGFKEESSQ